MVGVHDLRGQDGQDLILEILLHILLLRRLQLLKIQPAHPVRVELPLDIRIGLLPFLIKGGHRLQDLLDLLSRSHAGTAVPGLGVGVGHVEKTPHPDHEELIQVAGEDGHELHPLQKGNRDVPGLLQHPLVKLQPRQFSVLGIL